MLMMMIAVTMVIIVSVMFSMEWVKIATGRSNVGIARVVVRAPPAYECEDFSDDPREAGAHSRSGHVRATPRTSECQVNKNGRMSRSQSCELSRTCIMHDHNKTL